MRDVSTFPALLAEFLRGGWSDVDIAKLAGGNMLRVMDGAERVAASMSGTPPEVAPPTTPSGPLG